MSVTRRRALALGVGGAALLACGGVVRALTRSYALPAGEPSPLILTPKELAVARAIVEAFQPGDGAFPSGAALGVHHAIDEELFAQPDDVARDFRNALQLLEHAPLAFGRFARLTELAPDERMAVLDRMRMHGPDVLVQATIALQQLTTLFYFGHADTWGALAYDGPWQKDPKPHASHARYRAAQAARAAGARG